MMNVLIRTNHARRAVLIACISLSNMAEIAIVAIHMADMENGLHGTVVNNDALALALQFVAVDGQIWFSK